MLSKTALFIVDVQNGFITDQCNKIPEIVEKLQYDFDNVVICRFYNEEGSPFRSQLDWHQVEKGSDEYQLAFKPKDGAFIYDKPGYSGYTKELTDWLTNNGIEKVIVCGINTEVCVLHTATDLFLNNWNTEVLELACGSTKGTEYHNAGVLAIKHCIGDSSVI